MVELAGIGPGPFAAMMLADAGRRRGPGRAHRRRCAPHPDGPHPDVVLRGRRSVAVDLKHPDGRQVVLDLVAGSDVLLEGFRPGVTERLGLGPADCHAVNPALVYGRMTGWGQDGPLATVAGHDIGYIAVTGALNGSGRAGGRPVPPMNLLGDMGGGGMMLAFGVVSALLSAARTGAGPGRRRGDRGRYGGAGQLRARPAQRRRLAGPAPGTTCSTPALRSTRSTPAPTGGRSRSARWSRSSTPSCCDCPEWTVCRELAADRRLDPAGWPAAKQRWAELFATRSRDEWAEVFAGSDACVAPVLDWDEARRAPAAGRPRDLPAGGRGGAVRAGPAVRPDTVHTGPAAALAGRRHRRRAGRARHAPPPTSPPSAPAARSPR